MASTRWLFPAGTWIGAYESWRKRPGIYVSYTGYAIGTSIHKLSVAP